MEEIFAMSSSLTSFERREPLLPNKTPDSEGDRCMEEDENVPKAGVVGDLFTALWKPPDVEEKDLGVEKDIEGDVEGDSVIDENFVDSPTQPGSLSVTASGSNSYPELPCTMPGARPSPFMAHEASYCG